MSPAPAAPRGARERGLDGPPRTVPRLLARLRESDPGRPRLTWYGADGERVELSARVLENWVAKTANLLVEELDAAPGTQVRLDMPPHWRTAVWALAAWAVGARPAGDDEEADVLVTSGGLEPPAGGPDQRPAPLVVAVALPALARTAAGAGGLPPGVLDYNAEVGAFADSLPPLAEPAELDPVARLDPAWPPQVRLLVPADRFDLGRTLLAPLAADGSVVLLGGGCESADGADGPDAGRVAAQERTTARA